MSKTNVDIWLINMSTYLFTLTKSIISLLWFVKV